MAATLIKTATLDLATPAAIPYPSGLGGPNPDTQVAFQFCDGDGEADLRLTLGGTDPVIRIPDTTTTPAYIGPFPLANAPRFVASVAGSTTIRVTILEIVGER